MCEIWEEIKNKGKLEGLREGEAIGEANGEIKGILKSIHKLIAKNGYTLKEALDFLDIPEDEQSKYIEKFTS